MSDFLREYKYKPHHFLRVKFKEVIEDFKDDLDYLGNPKFINLPDDLPLYEDLDKKGFVWYRRLFDYEHSHICPYCDLSCNYYLGVYVNIENLRAKVQELDKIFPKVILKNIFDFLKKPEYYYYFTWSEFCWDREKYKCEEDFIPFIYFSKNLSDLSKLTGLNSRLNYKNLKEPYKKSWIKDLKKTSEICLKDIQF